MTDDYYKKIRNEYEKGSLTKENTLEDPIQQFKLWFEEALTFQTPEKNSMALTTVDHTGQPTSRIVLLKSFSSSGFIFFTNYNSRKMENLTENNRASLLFFWPSLERQIRIEGSLKKISEKESDEYFQTRPKGSQIAAWASSQSDPVTKRQSLEETYSKYENQFASSPTIPRPEFWGGVCMTPNYFEFWQGRVNRLHDRITYTEAPSRWTKERICP